MAEHLSANDLKRRYIEVMRGELGEFFHYLMQETSRLHLKWNEYEALFNAGPEKVTNMNLAAPGFFWLAQNALWHDIILNVCRITDNGTKVLSVKRLPGMTKIALRDELNALLNRLEGAAAPARKARDRYIAHLEYELLRDPTVQDAVMPERADVLNAIQAIDELLHFVDNHFTKSGPMLWEHLDAMGGASSLHDIIRRGLRDRMSGWPATTSPVDSLFSAFTPRWASCFAQLNELLVTRSIDGAGRRNFSFVSRSVGLICAPVEPLASANAAGTSCPCGNPS